MIPVDAQITCGGGTACHAFWFARDTEFLRGSGGCVSVIDCEVTGGADKGALVQIHNEGVLVRAFRAGDSVRAVFAWGDTGEAGGGLDVPEVGIWAIGHTGIVVEESGG